jgi:hypothetical protein
MPRTPIDYSKTLIYKLVHKDDLENSNIYVGSTTDFRKRKWSHKSKCNNPNSKRHHLKVYENIRENDGWDEWVMLEIEKFPCQDKREADARERYWCEFYKSELNMQVPGRKTEEMKELSKKYYQEHQEKKLEYQNQYYLDHKEEKKKYQNQYGEKNFEKITAQKKEKVICDCGKSMRRTSLSRHKKTTCKSINV